MYNITSFKHIIITKVLYQKNLQLLFLFCGGISTGEPSFDRTVRNCNRQVYHLTLLLLGLGCIKDFWKIVELIRVIEYPSVHTCVPVYHTFVKLHVAVKEPVPRFLRRHVQQVPNQKHESHRSFPHWDGPKILLGKGCVGKRLWMFVNELEHGVSYDLEQVVFIL